MSGWQRLINPPSSSTCFRTLDAPIAAQI